MADAVLAPALPLVGEVQQDGHGPVGGMGEPGFRSLTGLELPPQREEGRGLRLRQQCPD
jgi:hypothetical protein